MIGLTRTSDPRQFYLGDEEAAFRKDLCAFLSAEAGETARARHYNERAYLGWDPEFRHAFRRELGRRGYIGLGWPREHSGAGKDMVFQLLYCEEMEYHNAPGMEPATTYVPYVIMWFGTADQQAYFLPRLRQGELSFFLGYSEPGAGSDLANLSAKAVEVGDHFLITGEKSYSTYADIADYGLVAARTNRGVKRHEGISMFLVDMRLPGIRVAQHRTVAGFDHPSVYFDNVAVPASMLVGQQDRGWDVLMGAINFERAALGSPGLLERQMRRLVAFASADAHGPASVRDDLNADRLVTATIEADAARLYAYEVVCWQAAGERPQHEASLAALLKREAARLLDVTGLELLGSDSQLRGSSAPLNGAVEQEYREHIYFHFAAGGFDITRNVIATRGLGLPR